MHLKVFILCLINSSFSSDFEKFSSGWPLPQFLHHYCLSICQKQNDCRSRDLWLGLCPSSIVKSFTQCIEDGQFWCCISYYQGMRIIGTFSQIQLDYSMFLLHQFSLSLPKCSQIQLSLPVLSPSIPLNPCQIPLVLIPT